MTAVDPTGARAAAQAAPEAGIATVVDAATLRNAAEGLPGIPSDREGPAFREPWEARAFAMTLALHERGLFTWAEWATALGAEIERARRAGDSSIGETNYRHWLAALERLVQERSVADRATLVRYRDAWRRAAGRTPHGTPVLLAPEDLD